MILPRVPKDCTASIKRASTASRCSEQPAFASTLVSAVCADSTVTFVKGVTVKLSANDGAFSPLPKSAAGKILKHVLREPYWADHDKRISGA